MIKKHNWNQLVLNPTPQRKLRTRKRWWTDRIFSHRFVQLDGDGLHLGVFSQGIFTPEGMQRCQSTAEAGQTHIEKKYFRVDVAQRWILTVLVQCRTFYTRQRGSERAGSCSNLSWTHTQKKENLLYLPFFTFSRNEETYQTVPVSSAAETDKALSILEVKMADTRPYWELLALLMASSWLLKLNIHCTGPKIWQDNWIGHVRTSSYLTSWTTFSKICTAAVHGAEIQHGTLHVCACVCM